MDEELAIDPAVVVSETDAAHSSGDEEGWLARPHQRRRCVGTEVATNENSHSPGEEDNSDDDVDMNDAAGPDDLYCKNVDDEDEAWVYKYMRSGREESVSVRQQQQQSDASTCNERTDGDGNHSEQDPNPSIESNKKMGEDSENKKLSSENQAQGKDNNQETSGHQDESTPENPQLQQALLLKPRTSDAILSCPRCFNIVCMDCQQHERYANQYRAMFVMNIGVDWNKRMIYDETVGGLKLGSLAGVARGSSREENNAQIREDHADEVAEPDTIPHDDTTEHDHTVSTNKEKEDLYYSVHCSYCQWGVAALDMKDEIYYFFGCIASA